MSEIKNKTINSIKRSLRSFSNSPVRKPQHLTGELNGKASPANTRKSRITKPTNDCIEIPLNSDMEISTDANNNKIQPAKNSSSKMPTQNFPVINRVKRVQESDSDSSDSEYAEEKPTKTPNRSKSASAKTTKAKREPAKKCGLCDRKGKKLTTTKCCGNVICDDLAKYRPFSFSLDSCYRDHDRYTLCSFHFVEGHKGKWQECVQCKKFVKECGFDNEEMFNFPKIENAATITCVNCGFAAENVKAFHHKPSKGYFCLKAECNKVKNSL